MVLMSQRYPTAQSLVLFAVIGTATLMAAPAGQLSFTTKTDLAAASSPAGVAIGDLNGDGRLDLVSVNTGANTVSVFLSTGIGTFGPGTEFATGALPHAVALADVNRDGILDLIVANTGSDSVSILFGRGTGAFTNRTDVATGVGPFY